MRLQLTILPHISTGAFLSTVLFTSLSGTLLLTWIGTAALFVIRSSNIFFIF